MLFERELKKVLQYATTWKAIVLLDEADVFLEAREDSKNPDRNSLVASKVTYPLQMTDILECPHNY